jgi:hypothetical protein
MPSSTPKWEWFITYGRNILVISFSIDHIAKESIRRAQLSYHYYYSNHHHYHHHHHYDHHFIIMTIMTSIAIIIIINIQLRNNITITTILSKSYHSNSHVTLSACIQQRLHMNMPVSQSTTSCNRHGRKLYFATDISDCVDTFEYDIEHT